MRFVETNVFLYVMTANPVFGPIAKRIFERIERGEEAITSSLAVAEVCVWLEYHKVKGRVPLFLKALQSYSTLVKIDTTYGDLLKANELVSTYLRLEFFDRVYLAQMLRMGVREIYSNDKGFDTVRGIKRLFA